MRIEPSGAPLSRRSAKTPVGGTDNRYRHLSTTLKMAISATSPAGNSGLDSLAALARSLSSAARELSHAAGFARQGQSATRQTDETLRAIRAIVQEASNKPGGSAEQDDMEQKLRGLRDTVSHLQTTSFQGLPVFSGDTLRVQVQSADISASSAVEVKTSADARTTLLEFGSNETPDLDSIDQALAATETLDREFETAARKIEGARSIVAQERISSIAAATETTEKVNAQELGERVANGLRENAADLAKLHSAPDANTLLTLLEDEA